MLLRLLQALLQQHASKCWMHPWCVTYYLYYWSDGMDIPSWPTGWLVVFTLVYHFTCPEWRLPVPQGCTPNCSDIGVVRLEQVKYNVNSCRVGHLPLQVKDGVQYPDKTQFSEGKILRIIMNFECNVLYQEVKIHLYLSGLHFHVRIGGNGIKGISQNNMYISQM